MAPYRLGDWAYTQGKDGMCYAIYLRKEGENTPVLFMKNDPVLENVVMLRHLTSGAECPVRRLDNSALRPKEKGYEIVFPSEVVPDRYADVFIIERTSVSD